MFELILLGTLWTCAAATAIRLLVRSDVANRSANGFLAALCGAIALTLNAEGLYATLDPLLGGLNLVDLAKHTALVLCAFFLARTALGGADRTRGRYSRVLLVGMAVAITIQTLAFLAVDADPSTTDFMETFGSQPAAVVYSFAHFIYFGLAEAITLWAACQFFRAADGWVGRIGAIALAAGAIAAACNVVVIVVREFSRTAGATDIASALQPPYKVLLIAIAVGNCVGLGLPALQGAIRRRRRAREITGLLRVLEPARQRVVEHDDRFLVQSGDSSDDMTRLEIAAIGIRDAQSIQGEQISLDPVELKALVAAERLLVVT